MGNIRVCANLRSGIRVLTFIVGIAQMSGAQAVSQLNASEPPASSTKAGQKQPLGDTNPPSICISAGKAAEPAAHGPHAVTLSWHASVPATTSDNDVISCYLIYRTAVSWNPGTAPLIGVTHAPDTNYVDLHVESGNYYYAVRAVSHRGVQSKFSKELPVQVPH